MKIGPLWVTALVLHLLGAGLAPDADARGRSQRIRLGDRSREGTGDPGRERAHDGAILGPELPGERGDGSTAGKQELIGEAKAKPRARALRLRPEDLQRLLRRFSHEPSVEAAQEAALRLVLAEPGRPGRWLRRAERAAWLPKLQLGAGLQQRRDQRLEEEVGSPNLFRADATNQITYEIKLSWDLPRLIFEPNALRVIHTAQRLSELREQVVVQVTRLYFERRRLQIEALARPVTTASVALGREMRLAEQTALLNALTGGLFRSGRGAGAARR